MITLRTRAGGAARLAAACTLLLIAPATAAGDLAALGEKLFLDKRLSSDGSIACASCHRPDRAFADGLPVAVGIGGAKGTRNTPSLLNIRDHGVFLWDGRRESLESQVAEPLTNPVEHGFANQQSMLRMLEADRGYSAQFKKLSAKPRIEKADLTAALAAYVKALPSGGSRFDRYQSGDSTALDAVEREGLELFRGRAQCAACHRLDGSRASFTDDKFHALGVGQKSLASDIARCAGRSVKLDVAGREVAIATEPRLAALGRFNVTLAPADIGKYRTPSLRNVAATAPYMHDGSVPTLEEAVERELYYRSLQQGRPVVLTAREKAALVAFLRALDSESLEGKSPAR